MAILASFTTWAKRIKRDAIMLWFACRHQGTPLFIKAWCLFTVAYALSPIDLIPDFIPILGYLDEMILLPAMIWLATYLLPLQITKECQLQAEEWMMERRTKPKSYLGAVMVVLIWLMLIYIGWNWYASQI